MTDDYTAACERAAGHACAELAIGVPPETVADALLTQALALWGAHTGRHTAARELMRVWREVRDGDQR